MTPFFLPVQDAMLVCCDTCSWYAENLSNWQAGRLSKPEELWFTYEEEGTPEDFFVPYVWSLIVSSSTIPWNLHAIALFQPVASASDTALAEDNAASTHFQEPDSLSSLKPNELHV